MDLEERRDVPGAERLTLGHHGGLPATPAPLRAPSTLRTFGATLAVEDRNRCRVPPDLRDIVRYDEGDVRLLHEGHRARLQLRLADTGFRLEAHEGLPRALTKPIEDLGRRLQVQAQDAVAARDLAGLFLRGREI